MSSGWSGRSRPAVACSSLPALTSTSSRLPRFYNTLTTNCTTMILTHATVNPGHVPFSWKILVSGYAPEYVYDGGRLDRSCPSPS